MALLSILTLFISLAIAILFVLTLQNTFKAISPRNRTMEPAMVWLIFIPLFNYIWQFIVFKRLSDSVGKELMQKGKPTDMQPLYLLGLVPCILLCITFIFKVISIEMPPIAGMLIGLGFIACGTTYWIMIHNYRKKIKELRNDFTDSVIFNS